MWKRVHAEFVADPAITIPILGPFHLIIGYEFAPGLLVAPSRVACVDVSDVSSRYGNAVESEPSSHEAADDNILDLTSRNLALNFRAVGKQTIARGRPADCAQLVVVLTTNLRLTRKRRIARLGSKGCGGVAHSLL